jgi:hypothetical protein
LLDRLRLISSLFQNLSSAQQLQPQQLGVQPGQLSDYKKLLFRSDSVHDDGLVPSAPPASNEKKTEGIFHDEEGKVRFVMYLLFKCT